MACMQALLLSTDWAYSTAWECVRVSNVPQCGGDDGVDGVRSVRRTQLTFCCRRFSGFTGGLSCPQLRYPVSYVPRCGGNGGLEGVCTFCCFNATGDRDILIFYKF